ncbi:MAG: flagellar basal body protein [Dysosmobacter sp.]
MSMTGAMSAAISGMKTHMQALNVVGNNIANVNTYGYTVLLIRESRASSRTFISRQAAVYAF